jgi:hypothetical protein
LIQLSEPISPTDVMPEYKLPLMKNKNYIVQPNKKPLRQTDSIITTLSDVDKERVDYIEKIKGETLFYQLFRNTIRFLLNRYENIAVREEIETEISHSFSLYSEKVSKIVLLLHKLIKNQIQFTGNEKHYKDSKNLSLCIVKDKEKCEKAGSLCYFSENCTLILPEQNLITGKTNEAMYYGKMADEFIRYKQIRNFMFEPQSYLSFTSLPYQLRENEMILLQSLLTQEYFENLIPAIKNPYVHFNSYDEAEPQTSQAYDNVITKLSSSSLEKKEVPMKKKPTKKLVILEEEPEKEKEESLKNKTKKERKNKTQKKDTRKR